MYKSVVFSVFTMSCMLFQNVFITRKENTIPIKQSNSVFLSLKGHFKKIMVKTHDIKKCTTLTNHF